jgi:hypothetical protein
MNIEGQVIQRENAGKEDLTVFLPAPPVCCTIGGRAAPPRGSGKT